MTGAEDAATPPDSPAVSAAREQLELKRLRLEQRRLGLEDQVARLEAKSKVAKSSIEAVKAYLPSTLDIPVEKDTLTSQGEATGLAAVYAGRATMQSVDDIADQVVSVTNSMSDPQVLVVADGSFVVDQQQADQIGVRLGLLEDALTDAGFAVGTEDQPIASPALQDTVSTGDGRRLLGVAPVAGALASLLPSVVTSLTRLFSHQYTVSGTKVETPDLGVDMRLAGAVRAKMSSDPSVEIMVGRLWVPSGSTLLQRLILLADRMLEVQKRALAADSARDVAAASVVRTREALAAAREQRKELASIAPTDAPSSDAAGVSGWQSAWDEIGAELDTLSAELADLETDVAEKDGEAERLAALVTDIEEFVAEVLTAPEEGVAPLVGATRGEWLRGSDQRLIVYARVLSAGLDQVLDVKLGPDKRCVISGASVEYAAVGQAGSLLFAGTYDGLWTASMKLTEPSTFQGEAVGYTAVANVRRPPPPPTG